MEEGAILEQPSTHIRFYSRILSVAGWMCQWASEVSGNGREEYLASDNTIRRATDGPQVNAVLHVVLLQFGQDVLAIGVLAKGCDVGPDLERKHNCYYTGPHNT